MDQGRITGLFDEQGHLQDITTLESRPPTDFCRRENRSCFTPNPQVAEYCARHAKRRVNVHSVVIVVIRIPNSAIESLSERDLRHLHWPSDDWKEMIWRNRSKKKAHRPSERDCGHPPGYWAHSPEARFGLRKSG